MANVPVILNMEFRDNSAEPQILTYAVTSTPSTEGSSQLPGTFQKGPNGVNFDIKRLFSYSIAKTLGCVFNQPLDSDIVAI